MSKSLSAAAQALFDSEVKQAFQGTGVLKDAVTVRNNVVGDTYKFRKIGKGLANQKASQDDVTPMDVAHSLQTATLGNWNAPEYTDIFDQAEVNFDERSELAQVIAMALGRRCDQIIIDALTAATPVGTVGTDVGGTGTDWNIEKLLQASRMLNAAGVPSGDRHLALSAKGLELMLHEDKVSSYDYAALKALTVGDIDTFNGFKFHMIEDRDENGLPLASSTRTSYAWHKSAIGLAIGIDIKTEVNYIAQKTSWLCNGVFKAGAIARDGDGIVDITTTEA